MFYRFRFFRQARKIKLPSAEKESIKRLLDTFIVEHPVRASQSERLLPQRSKTITLFSSLLRPIPIMALFLLVIGAGTASAAEGALPDNPPLYFIKTNITEPIRRAMALTPKAKAEVETAITVRRLQEAEAMAAKTNSDPIVQNQANERFEHQIDRAETQIKSLTDHRDEEVAHALNETIQEAQQRCVQARDDYDHQDYTSTSTRSHAEPEHGSKLEHEDAFEPVHLLPLDLRERRRPFPQPGQQNAEGSETTSTHHWLGRHHDVQQQNRVELEGDR